MGFLWGCTVPLGNFAQISRFYYEHSLKSRSREAAILKESEVFLFLGIIFFCSPQPYAVPSCKTVEELSLDHSSLIEQKTLIYFNADFDFALTCPTSYSCLGLGSISGHGRRRKSSLALTPNCLIKNVCRLGR